MGVFAVASASSWGIARVIELMKGESWDADEVELVVGHARNCADRCPGRR